MKRNPLDDIISIIKLWGEYMELRVLRYFLAVANEGNITKAAEMLHVTQPTLSRQLMDLEDELGATLFLRGKRAVTLTDEGTLFLQRAQEIVELADKAEREFIERHDLINGVISIGCVETMGSHLLADLIVKFHNKYPQVQFDLYNGYSDDIKDRIDKGLVDIGLLMTPVEISKYDFMRLDAKDTWGILVPSDDEIAGKDSVNLRDIADKPLILPKRSAVRNEVINWFGVPAERLNIVATHTLLSNTVLLVERGMGYAVTLNGSLATRSSAKTKFIPLSPERTTDNVFVWKKNHLFNAAVSLFIQMARMLKEEL